MTRTGNHRPIVDRQASGWDKVKKKKLLEEEDERLKGSLTKYFKQKEVDPGTAGKKCLSFYIIRYFSVVSLTVGSIKLKYPLHSTFSEQNYQSSRIEPEPSFQQSFNPLQSNTPDNLEEALVTPSLPSQEKNIDNDAEEQGIRDKTDIGSSLSSSSVDFNERENENATTKLPIQCVSDQILEENDDSHQADGELNSSGFGTDLECTLTSKMQTVQL